MMQSPVQARSTTASSPELGPENALSSRSDLAEMPGHQGTTLEHRALDANQPMMRDAVLDDVEAYKALCACS